jgi:hypothetical protein
LPSNKKMVTVKNYIEKTNLIEFVDIAHKQAHDFTLESLEFYGEDKEIDETIDLWIDTVNSLLSQKPEAKIQPPTANRQPPTAKSQQQKTELVRGLSKEIFIINRFNSLVDKKVNKRQLRLVHADINKAVAEGKVSSKSPYAALIEKINKFVKNALQAVLDQNFADEKTFELDFEDKDTLAEAAKVKVYPSVKVFKSIANLQGKTPDQKTVENLVKRIESTIKNSSENDPFIDDLKEAKTQLNQWEPNTPLDLIVYASLDGVNTHYNSLGQVFTYCECAIQKKKNDENLGGLGFAAEISIIRDIVLTATAAMSAANTANNDSASVHPDSSQIDYEIDYTPEQAPDFNSHFGQAKPNLGGTPMYSPMQLMKGTKAKTFELGNSDLAKFMGQIERKPVESVLMGLLAPRSSGKTHMLMRATGQFSRTNKVLFCSLEEHPKSELFKAKIKKYIAPDNYSNIQFADQEQIRSMGPNPWDNFNALCANFDIIMVDSWKIFTQDFGKEFSLRHWRKLHNGKLLIAIIHLNADGSAKGGSNTEQDADIVCRIDKFSDWKKNLAYWPKNRYMDKDFNDMIYSPSFNKLLTQEEFETMHGPIENYKFII